MPSGIVKKYAFALKVICQKILTRVPKIVYTNPRSLKGRARGSIAQLGEHLPYKQGVTGSSPVAPTIWSGSSVG